ncbi:hypothetical protein ASE01_19955 [Nocardioides sp. Root190]|uniref:hypothetical protein n=1 Tax=Nocardioides sp. Root190 TaxID=1736488 RepID=UPI0006FF805D|nr:hypothetical protein [Nocardioides sp. Root190]KRB73052.1 hypothetical protein ASE01_19955 [Nocardioides sp. Root190]
MNGPDHYRESERLIAAGEAVVEEIRAAKGDEARRDALGKQAGGIWAQAQVHATLALTAATVAPTATFDGGDGRTETFTGVEWSEATS